MSRVQQSRIPLDDLDRRLSETTLSELVERGYTRTEIAEFVAEEPRDVRRALNHFGLETDSNKALASNSVAYQLWQMDADEPFGDETGAGR